MARDLFYDRRQVLKNKWAIENLKEQVEKGGGISDDILLTIRRQDFYYTNDASLYEWLQGKVDELGYTLEDKTITYYDENEELQTQSGKLLSKVLYYRYFKDVNAESDEIRGLLYDDKSSIIHGESNIDMSFQGSAFLLNDKLIENFEDEVCDELGFIVKNFDLISVFYILESLT
jgi:hypothetical protein